MEYILRDAQYTIAPLETAFWTVQVDNSRQTLESTDDGFSELAWSSVARFADRTKKREPIQRATVENGINTSERYIDTLRAQGTAECRCRIVQMVRVCAHGLIGSERSDVLSRSFPENGGQRSYVNCLREHGVTANSERASRVLHNAS